LKTIKTLTKRVKKKKESKVERSNWKTLHIQIRIE
jgi:ribosomal protein L35